MPISIIVENGTNVTNANSYNSIIELRSFALNRGIELPSVDDDVATMAIKATDYLETKAEEYKGLPTYTDQSLQWPRIGVFIYEVEQPSNSIPKQLKTAHAMLVLAVNEGLSLLPNYSPQDYVIEETVGPIKTKYSDPSSVGIENTFTGVDKFLEPLINKGLNSFSLQTIRV